MKVTFQCLAVQLTELHDAKSGMLLLLLHHILWQVLGLVFFAAAEQGAGATGSGPLRSSEVIVV